MTKEANKTEAKETKKKDLKYFYAVGKRKTAVAQVRIYPVEKSKEIVVNDKKLATYFPISRQRETIKSPIVSVGQDGKFDVTVRVMGGGISAQADAIRLGISRALLKFDDTFRKALKDRGFLTRDSREVERKKAGLKKARKSPQWAKR